MPDETGCAPEDLEPDRVTIKLLCAGCREPFDLPGHIWVALNYPTGNFYHQACIPTGTSARRVTEAMEGDITAGLQRLAERTPCRPEESVIRESVGPTQDR